MKNVEKSTQAKAVANISSSVILTVLNILVMFLSRVVFIHMLGEYFLGLNGLFSNILGILSLSDLGISTALMFSLYKPLAENDEAKISALIAFFKKIFIGIAVAIVVAGLAVLPFLDLLINMDVEIPNTELYYIIVLLTTASSYLFVYRSILIKADQKSYVVNKIQIVYNLVNFIVQVSILYFLQDYFIYISAALVMNVANNIILNAKAHKLYPYLKTTKTTLTAAEKKEVTKNFGSLFLYKFCGTIQTNTDSLLITLFVGTVTVGYYSNYLLILSSLTTVINIVFESIKATVGNLIVTEKDKSSHFHYYKILDYFNFCVTSFITVAFAVALSDFIGIMFGEDYILSTTVLVICMFNFYKTNIRQTIWVFRETAGLFKMTQYITLTSALFNLVFSIVLGYYFGLAGIILGTVLAHFVYAWWKEPCIIFKNYFKVSAMHYFKTYILRFLIMLIAYFSTVFLCSLIGLENMYLAFGVKVLICAVVPNVIVILFTFKTAEFKHLLEAIKNRNK